MRISRRHLLLSASAPLFAQRREAAERPNVLLVLARDVPAWILGCYGNQETKTPNIDLLARMGTKFTNSCVYTPASSPSQATLFTGRLPRQHGIIDYLTANPIANPPQGQKEAPASFRNETMISDVLAGAGYVCGYVGAWLMGDAAQPGHGFTHVCTLGDRFSYTDPELHKNGQLAKGQGYAADLLTTNCLEFIDKQGAGKPFFLTAAYPNAHPPYDGQPQEDYALYARAEFQSFRFAPRASSALQNQELLEDTAGSLRRYCAAITALDARFGLLVKRLQERKLWENTLIVFTSDCGNLAGHHGLWGGGLASNPINMYEPALQVPMIWSWPGRVPVAGFRPELVSFYDFLPSVCEATGIPLRTGKDLCGSSYAELAFGRGGDPRRPWRTRLFAEYRNTEMARDSRYKLIVRDRGQGAGELYDLRADPGENTNQYDNDEYVAVRRRLTGDLEKWRGQYK